MPSKRSKSRDEPRDSQPTEHVVRPNRLRRYPVFTSSPTDEGIMVALASVEKYRAEIAKIK
jgi:hypothetical protein